MNIDGVNTLACLKPIEEVRGEIRIYPLPHMPVVKDLVQGEINISNSIIEDFVILRQDGSPTYQLSAVIDDHLMKITHVIRGDDHKINTFKQKQIYEAMKWNVPEFAHIPLIHSEKGSKLSKRDKASTIDDYIKIGILSDALRNYLLRLGWHTKIKKSLR